jgi:hypothetical protein
MKPPSHSISLDVEQDLRAATTVGDVIILKSLPERMNVGYPANIRQSGDPSPI